MSIDPNTGNYIPVEQEILGGTVQSNLATVSSPILPTVDPSQVYSADNIQQATTSPVTKPDLSDPLGMYDYYMSSPEIQKAQQGYQTAFGDLTKARQTARARQLAIEQNPLESMSYITGQQSRAGQIDSLVTQALAENVNVAQSALTALKETAANKFQIAQSQRNELTNLIANNPGAGIAYTDNYEDAIKKAEVYQQQKQVESIALQYPDAKIKKTDSMEVVTKKIADYERKQEEKAKEDAEEAAKKAYKQSLKDQLIALGSSVKGLSKNELEKKLKKKNKEALDQAQKLADLEYKKVLKGLSDSGDSNDYEKTEKQLYTDVDNWKQKMRDGKANWADAWSSIQRNYGLSVDTIDALLGLDYRDKYDK